MASSKETYANVSAAMTWATDHGAQVINLSLGGAASLLRSSAPMARWLEEKYDRN